MLKTKFIQMVFTAVVMSTSIAYAGPFFVTYTYSDVEGSDLKDVSINLTAAKPEAGDNQCVLQFPQDNGGPYVGATGANAYGLGWQSATHDVVRNSEVYVDYEGGNVEYLTADAAGTGKVTGTKTVTVAGGNVQMLVAGTVSVDGHEPSGGMFSTTEGKPETSTAKTVLNVINNATVGKIYAGCITSGYKTDAEIGFFTLNGDVEINVKDSSAVTGEIRGGGGSYGCVDGTVTINISGNATVEGNIYGGARQKDAFVNGTDITISDNAQIKQNVYGGGSYSGGSSVVKGDTAVTIEGGTVDGTVYGGGVKDKVEGSTKVVLSGGAVKGDVVASGEGVSTVAKNAEVVIQGAGTEVEGTIYGKSAEAEVGGSTMLSVETNATAKVADFDSIVIAANTEVLFEQVTLSASGTTINVAEGAHLTLGTIVGNTSTYVTRSLTESKGLELRGFGTITLTEEAQDYIDTYGVNFVVEIDSTNANNTEFKLLTLHGYDGTPYIASEDLVTVTFVDANDNVLDSNVSEIVIDEATGQYKVTATVTVPEPTTATLSLLALAGLCARRRRK